MNNQNREIVVLFTSGEMNEQALEKELDCLNIILQRVESAKAFCKVHELVDRNRITGKEAKLIRSYYQKELKRFRFLICKN